MTKATESTQASGVFTLSYRKYHHAHTKAHAYLFYILYKMSIYWHIVTLSYLVVHILKTTLRLWSCIILWFTVNIWGYYFLLSKMRHDFIYLCTTQHISNYFFTSL